ncbi:low affinity immunoglobulin gamma Fc region receptor II-like isoform X2 [Thunnus thynnus]|uniref:low affinity immunoglobulin gamma Fc region receptor II-like isoform X2 n=2 Tax=Thunnus thynnus TaxID=8237 RepID=UPI0035279C24
MEVAALCIRLLVTVSTLLCAHAQKNDAVFCIVPNRLQFFQYESVTFYCEEFDGSTGCKRVHESKGKIPRCATNRTESAGSSCDIVNVYPEDSGEYWCEAGGGRNSSINITVTGGSVILESPGLPVMEGETVTLCCRNKTTSANLPADFYKNGLFIRTEPTGNMTIYNVSKSDEGLYKCNISGAGESPESRLAVGSDSCIISHPDSNSNTSKIVPWIIVTVLLVVLLVVVVGVHHFGKVLLCSSTPTLGSGAAEDQTVSVESHAADADNVTYASVTKTRKKKDEDEDKFSSVPIYYTLGLDETQQLETGVSIITTDAAPSADTNSRFAEDDFYSTIQSLRAETLTEKGALKKHELCLVYHKCTFFIVPTVTDELNYILQNKSSIACVS